MSGPENGNEYLSFLELMRLEKINEVTYRSIALPFSPGGPLNPLKRAYGGHVYAQASWSACQTVSEGFLLHNITGHFILPASPTVPFVYKVHNIRDGRSYCQRIVNVTQREGHGICFTCTISLKRAETSVLDEQEKMDIWDRYDAVLKGKTPYDFEECPGMDVPWFWKRRAETGLNDKFPGLQMHKVGMSAYNDVRHPLDKRQLILYRAIGAMPPNPNLHLVAHLYASDRNSLFIVANHWDVGAIYTNMASLAHTVIFHAPIEDLMFGASRDRNSPLDDSTVKWFGKEDFSTRMTGGRGIFHSNVYTPNGTHAASVMQDGMIRVQKKSEASGEEVEAVKALERRRQPREKL